MNEVLRDWYCGDCEAGVQRWNRILERHGLSDRLRLPGSQVQSRHRHVLVAPLRSKRRRRCPTPSGSAGSTSGCQAPIDREYLLSIMAEPVYEPGKFANYIAPPLRGINRMPIDFEYVRTEA